MPAVKDLTVKWGESAKAEMPRVGSYRLSFLKHLPVPGTCSAHLIPMTIFFFNHHFAGEETKPQKE